MKRNKVIFILLFLITKMLYSSGTMNLIVKNANCGAGFEEAYFKSMFWNPVLGLPLWNEATHVQRYGLIQLEHTDDGEKMLWYLPVYFPSLQRSA